MAIILDIGLLARREAQTLTPADLCKMALCYAVAQALPTATVFASAQAQGVAAPAVFVRFDKLQQRSLFGRLARISLTAECRYLAVQAADDGENEAAMQALLDASVQMAAAQTDFVSTGRVARRTADGAIMTCEIRFDYDRDTVAWQAEGVMQTLILAAAADEVF